MINRTDACTHAAIGWAYSQGVKASSRGDSEHAGSAWNAHIVLVEAFAEIERLRSELKEKGHG